MSAIWKYDDDRVAHADGTGTYEKGWYAAAPSTAEAGQSPNAGPFATREEAVKRAEEIKKDEEAQNANA